MKLQTQVGILGYGVVGKATHHSFLQHHAVATYDPQFGSSMADLRDCSHVFVCFPVIGSSGVCNLFSEIGKLKSINPQCNIVLRSTVPPGTCRELQTHLNEKILYVPEFLRDRFWQTDCLRRPILVGADRDVEFTFVSGDEAVRCTLEEAEIVKMFSNNIAAMKIVFANHFYDLCNKQAVDYQNVLDNFHLVEHRDQTYLDTHQDLRGFGGKCLPKDLDFLIDTFEQLGIEQTLFTAMRTDNAKWPTTVRKS